MIVKNYDLSPEERTRYANDVSAGKIIPLSGETYLQAWIRINQHQKSINDY